MVSKFKGIILHWTAGTGKPNADDMEHYHYLVGVYGDCYNGNFKPEDNLNCVDGKYAAQVGGGNTCRIGMAVCGMEGYLPSIGISSTHFPLTPKQCERFFKRVAEVAIQYDIDPNNGNIMTHKRFGEEDPTTTSYGKIDISWLPPEIIGNFVGDLEDFILSKVRWYWYRIKEGVIKDGTE